MVILFAMYGLPDYLRAEQSSCLIKQKTYNDINVDHNRRYHFKLPTAFV